MTTSVVPGLHINTGDPTKVSRRRGILAVAIFREVLGIEMEIARDTFTTLPAVVTFDDIIHHLSESRRKEAQDDSLPDITLEEAITAANEAKAELENSELAYEVSVVEPGSTNEAGHVDPLVRTLAQYIKNGTRGRHRVILLRGATGGGKTSKVRAAAREAGIERSEVFDTSIPTTQPEDLAGIPFPDPNDERYFYYRMPRELFGKKVMFFDECNRAASTKTFDAMMQLVLERRINGHDFPEVQAVVMAMNPDDETGDYQVETMDRAFWERIDHTIDVPYAYDATIIGDNIGNPHVAEIGVKWVMELGESSRKQLNPRRLEKILWAYLMGEDLSTTLDKLRYTVPLDKLLAALKAESILTLEQLLEHPEEIEAKLKAGGKLAADLQYRYVELMQLMAKRHMREEIVTVAHLYKYVKRDLIPNVNRDKRLWNFLSASLKRYATPEQTEMFFKVLAERQAGRDSIADQLSQISARLREGKVEENGELVKDVPMAAPAA